MIDVELRVASRPLEPFTAGGGIVLSESAAARFHRVRSMRHQVIVGGPHAFERLGREVPGVPVEERAQLDDDGIVREGASVRAGSILVGLVARRAICSVAAPGFGAEGCDGRDGSLRAEMDGWVERVERRRTASGAERIDVVVRREERGVRPGDVLAAQGLHATVTRVVADGALDTLRDRDALWMAASGIVLFRWVSGAAEVLQARATGPYTLLTRQPLGSPASSAGQRIDGELLSSLLASGAPWNALELASVKSDDLDGRRRLACSLAEGAPRVEPGMPLAFSILGSELFAAGLELGVDERGGLQLAIADAASVRRACPERLESALTLHAASLEPAPGGLMCERLFGALDSEARLRKMARVELPFAVAHPWLSPAIALLVGRPEQEVLAGGIAREELAALDLEAIAQESGSRGGMARTLLASATRAESLMIETLPVLPAGLRPIVYLSGGRFATSDMNDHYRGLLQALVRYEKMASLGAPVSILESEARGVRAGVQNLIANGSGGPPVVSDGRLLKSLADLVSGRVRQSLVEKRVDFSACARIAPDPTLSTESLRVPLAVARVLLSPLAGDPAELLRARPLLAVIDGRALFLKAQLGDEPVIGIAPALADAMGVGFTGSLASLHLPLGAEAVAEARALSGKVLAARLPEVADEGWLARAAGSDDPIAVLVAAAIGGERDPVQGPLWRAALGRHPFAPLGGA